MAITLVPWRGNRLSLSGGLLILPSLWLCPGGLRQEFCATSFTVGLPGPENSPADFRCMLDINQRNTGSYFCRNSHKSIDINGYGKVFFSR